MSLAQKSKSEEDDREWILKTDSILYNNVSATLRPLQFYGMYPINGLPKWLFYIHAAFFTVVSSLPIPVLTVAYLYVNIHSMDLPAIIDVSFAAIEEGVTVLRYLTIRVYPETVRSAMKRLTSKEFNTYHPDQAPIVQETCNIFRKVFKMYLVASSAAIIILVVKPLLLRQKMFPNVIWVPFDTDNNDFNFGLVYAILTLATSNAGIGNTCLDSILLGCCFHAVAQIKIIKGTLKDIFKHAEEKINSEQKNLSTEEFEALKHQYIFNDICKCVDRYNLVREFSKDLEDTFSFSLFCQFSASIFVMGFACIQFFFVELWSVNFFVGVIWIATMTLQVFLFCLFGTLLNYESSTLVSDLYLTDWLDLDPRCQKAFTIIIENAKKPIMIKAGKFVDMSLETFATIMRRSYSLLALLNNYKNNNTLN